MEVERDMQIKKQQDIKDITRPEKALDLNINEASETLLRQNPKR